MVYTASGSLGLGTATPNEKLDVIGNIGLNEALRLYNSGRTAYSALKAPASPGNLLFTLPNSYGSSGQVLTSNGSGTLSWSTVSGSSGGDGGGTGTISNISAGRGISISGGSGPSATITNTGIFDIVAGANISISKNNSTGTATISASGGGGGPVTIQNYSGAMYPFTTRGFSMPI